MKTRHRLAVDNAKCFREDLQARGFSEIQKMGRSGEGGKLFPLTFNILMGTCLPCLVRG